MNEWVGAIAQIATRCNNLYVNIDRELDVDLRYHKRFLGRVLKVDEEVGYSTKVVFKDLSWPLCLTVEANSPKNNGNGFNLFFRLESLKRVVPASPIDK